MKFLSASYFLQLAISSILKCKHFNACVIIANCFTSSFLMNIMNGHFLCLLVTQIKLIQAVTVFIFFGGGDNPSNTKSLLLTLCPAITSCGVHGAIGDAGD